MVEIKANKLEAELDMLYEPQSQSWKETIDRIEEKITDLDKKMYVAIRKIESLEKYLYKIFGNN